MRETKGLRCAYAIYCNDQLLLDAPALGLRVACVLRYGITPCPLPQPRLSRKRVLEILPSDIDDLQPGLMGLRFHPTSLSEGISPPFSTTSVVVGG
jgi:hypothetical protein